jgi:hypothetical protein
MGVECIARFTVDLLSLTGLSVRNISKKRHRPLQSPNQSLRRAQASENKKGDANDTMGGKETRVSEWIRFYSDG